METNGAADKEPVLDSDSDPGEDVAIKTKNMRMLILYGSITGNGEKIAQHISDKIVDIDVDIEVMLLNTNTQADEYSQDELEILINQSRYIILITACRGGWKRSSLVQLIREHHSQFENAVEDDRVLLIVQSLAAVAANSEYEDTDAEFEQLKREANMEIDEKIDLWCGQRVANLNIPAERVISVAGALIWSRMSWLDSWYVPKHVRKWIRDWNGSKESDCVYTNLPKVMEEVEKFIRAKAREKP